MRTIGFHELHEQTVEVLRRVREDGEVFELTDQGEVVAHLVPAKPLSATSASLEEFLAEWDYLSREIGARWPEDASAVEAVREQRREL